MVDGRDGRETEVNEWRQDGEDATEQQQQQDGHAGRRMAEGRCGTVQHSNICSCESNASAVGFKLRGGVERCHTVLPPFLYRHALPVVVVVLRLLRRLGATHLHFAFWPSWPSTIVSHT